MKYTKKTDLTKGKIKQAFLDLLLEKKLEQITVSSISTKAEINRSSFYRYYEDKYVLMDDIIDGFIEDIKADNIRQEVNDSLDRFNHERAKEFFHYLQTYSKELNALFSDNAGRLFENRIREVLTNHFFSSEVVKFERNPKNMVIKSFLIDTIIYSLRYLGNVKSEEELDNLAEVMSDVYFKAFVPVANIDVERVEK
jgi:hypothetical protein